MIANVNMDELFAVMLMEEEGVKYETENAHDKLFKDALNDNCEFVEFINNFVMKNKQLKKDEVIKVRNSYLTNTYNLKEIDVIYKEKADDIYYIVEHQSTIDESMPYRMLIYCTSVLSGIAEKDKLRTKQYKIPTIIPIVVYTGEKRWNVVEKLTDKQIKVEGNESILELKYILIDINNMTDEELLANKTKFSFTMLIEKSRDAKDLERRLTRIAKNCTKEQALEMEGTIKYFYEPILGADAIAKIREFFDREGGEPIMTAVDYVKADIEKKREQAKREGKQEGRQEGKIEDAKKMKNMGMENKLICEVTGLSEKEIEDIAG